jgi:hypothetical protein
LSTLKQTGFVFLRDGHITPAHFEKTGLPVEVLSLVEISRLMWHTSNITSILTGQMTDPALLRSYQTKRQQLLHHPFMVERFGDILAKHRVP